MSNVRHDSVGAVRQNARKPRDTLNRPECRLCGYNHGNRQCSASGQTCHKCRQRNHFQSKYRSSTAQVRQSTLELPEEVFHSSQVGAGSSAMVTMEFSKPRAESRVTCQLDKGAECDVLSCEVTNVAANEMFYSSTSRKMT